MMKNGTPINEVMIPHGSSPGFMTIRAIVSATRRREAPPKAEVQTRVLLFEEKTRRIMWGATRPTKLIVPPAHTATLTARLPAPITKILRSETFTPRFRAFSSPPFKRSRGFKISAIKTNARTAGIITNLSSFIPRPLKLPRSQE